VSLRSQRISHETTQDRTHASAMRSQCLAALVMARSYYICTCLIIIVWCEFYYKNVLLASPEASNKRIKFSTAKKYIRHVVKIVRRLTLLLVF
jgi:hypothetical protein